MHDGLARQSLLDCSDVCFILRHDVLDDHHCLRPSPVALELFDQLGKSEELGSFLSLGAGRRGTNSTVVMARRTPSNDDGCLMLGVDCFESLDNFAGLVSVDVATMFCFRKTLCGQLHQVTVSLPQQHAACPRLLLADLLKDKPCAANTIKEAQQNGIHRNAVAGLTPVHLPLQRLAVIRVPTLLLTLCDLYLSC